MWKARSILFSAIILFVGLASARYYYKASQNNLSEQDLNTKYITKEVLTKEFSRTYNSKEANEAAQTDAMTEEQVMKYLGISSGDLASLIEDNASTFPYSKTNGTIIFRKTAIDKWLERCHVDAIEK